MKAQITLLKAVGISIAVVGISFYILDYIAHSRLNRVVNPTFDITKVVAIDRVSISEHSEVYNEDRFVEYECVYKDSCLDLVNMGRVDTLYNHVEDIVEILHTPISFPNSYFPSLIAPTPYSVSVPIVAFYNVYSLPSSSLNKVKLYIKGEIKNKISESAASVKYEISANRIDMALNNGSEVELSYSLGIDSNRVDAALVFSLHDGSLYAVVLTKALDIDNLLKTLTL